MLTIFEFSSRDLIQQQEDLTRTQNAGELHDVWRFLSPKVRDDMLEMKRQKEEQQLPDSPGSTGTSQQLPLPVSQSLSHP